MADHNFILPRDINRLWGPGGEVVVVVKPNQQLVREVKFAEENPLAVICAFIWGLMGIPFAIIGFSLVCAGISRSPSMDLPHPAYSVGIIFFGIGLVMCFFLCLSLCCRKSEHKRRIRLYMHDQCIPVLPDEPPIIPSPFPREMQVQPRQEPLQEQLSQSQPVLDQNSLEQLTPYQRFMLVRGQEYTASRNSTGGEILTGYEFNGDNRTAFHSTPSLNVQRNTSIGYHSTPRASSNPQDDARSRPIQPPSSTQSSTYALSESTPGLRPSASQTSLDRIMREVTAFASSIDDELDSDLRTGHSATQISESSPMIQGSGRRSPYDNSMLP